MEISLLLLGLSPPLYKKVINHFQSSLKLPHTFLQDNFKKVGLLSIFNFSTPFTDSLIIRVLVLKERGRA